LFLQFPLTQSSGQYLNLDPRHVSVFPHLPEFYHPQQLSSLQGIFLTVQNTDLEPELNFIPEPVKKLL